MKKNYFVLIFSLLFFIANAQQPFITSWKVNAADLNISIPRAGTGYDYTIDFGDGTVVNSVSQGISHSYSAAGVYNVSITGDFPRIFFFNSELSNSNKLLSIEQWGDIQWESMELAFYRCSNLVINATDAPDLSQVTNMDSMFFEAKLMNQNINHWDVSNVTNMSSLFTGASSFNQPVDDWNTSNVTNMSRMFSRASSFNQTLDSWNVSNVESMLNMFDLASSFNQPLNSWDVSNVTDMSNMFRNARFFNQSLNSWDVSNVISMSRMFYLAESFNQPINNWNMSSVTDVEGLFLGASSFNKPIDDWNITSVTILNNLFFNASSFNQPLNSWDVSNVTNMDSMFTNASSFNQPLNNWDVSNVTNMGSMFSGASSFNQPLNSWDVSNVTNMGGLFASASSFNQPLNSWDVSNATNMGGLFASASFFNHPLNSWDVSSVVNMQNMFLNTQNFDQPLNNWDISNVENLSSMFKSASFNQDISDWNFNSSTNLSGFLDDSKMDIANYELLLSQFVNLNLQDKTLGAKGLLYCDETIRENLTDSGWVINGDGRLIDCNDTFEQGAFVMRWKVPADDLTISIPTCFSSAYDYNVDYGDGIILSNINNQVNHTYAQPGVYTISVTGDFPRLCFNFSTDNNKIWSVEQWGTIEWESMASAFSECSNLKINALDAPNLTQVTSLSYMFYEATSFNESINHWDVSNIEDMSGLFIRAKAFNQHLTDWDTSNVTNMSRMFSNAISFNQTLDSWDVSQVESMSYMFNDALSFNMPLNSWDVSQVESMIYMFDDAFSFNQPLNNWDVSSVVNMRNMFSSAKKFNQSLNNWDVSNVTNMEEMFGGDTSINSCLYNMPLNNWNVSNVTNMRSMFRLNDNFNQDISNWDVSNVTNMGSMFRETKQFDQPLNDWDVSNVSNMAGMFWDAKQFDQPLNDWDVSNVNNMAGMFGGGPTSNGDGIKFNQPINNWDVSNVTSMYQMFLNAHSFNQALDNWDMSSVNTIDEMFRRATSFNGSVSNWDLSNVESLENLFREAESFNQPLNSWDISNVTDMEEVFRECVAFNQPLNNWDTSSVTNTNFMFAGASSFNQPLDTWNVSNITEMRNMFYKANSFNQELTNWNFNSTVSLRGFGGFGSGSSSLRSGLNFISETNMSISNYENLLFHFAQLGYQNKRLGAVNLYYCNEDVRDYLINELDWIINGDNLYPQCNYIEGLILYDGNNDGCDSSDIEVNDIVINASDGVNSYSTFAINGNYSIGVVGSSFDVSLINLPPYFNSFTDNATVNFSQSNIAEVDFCLTENQTENDLNIVFLPIDEARPGFESNYQLVTKNVGSEAISNVNVSLNYNDEQQTFVSASSEIDDSTNSSLSFELGTLLPFETRYIDLTMQTFQPPIVNANDILDFSSTITTETGDYTPEDNTYVLQQTVVNSFDPNDKQVLQGEEVHIDNINEYLDYIIRFQNTGTASAINVRILDTLHPKLDWTTMTPISASHDYHVVITNANQVEFLFDNINLPDQVSNEPESHGYIAYKIKPKTNVQVGDVISGNANIYFDYNEPIITNTVETLINDNLSTNNITNILYQVSLYPNPAQDLVYIEFTEVTELEQVIIYSIQGKEVKNIIGSSTILDLKLLNSGLYLVKIVTNQGSILKKLIKN